MICGVLALCLILHHHVTVILLHSLSIAKKTYEWKWPGPDLQHLPTFPAPSRQSQKDRKMTREDLEVLRYLGANHLYAASSLHAFSGIAAHSPGGRTTAIQDKL